MSRATLDGFVHVEDGRLVDGQGRPLAMRGVGLGNWLLPEGYMWRFPREGPQSPREIEAFVTELVGAPAAERFWRAFEERFIDEADIARIASEGFDHVRLPLHARRLIEEDGTLRPEGFAPVDRLIGWCRAHGLWVVLDLHGAPGGQTGTNIDDSPRGQPDLFVVGGRYRELTIALWRALATRYRDETVVAAYDLLNEPLPHEWADRHGSDLVALYRELTRVVREVDPHHLLTYEGTRWATDWSLFTDGWDPNSMLQFHKYWSRPDRASVAGFVEVGRGLGLPVYMGEGGENDPDWLATAFGLYEDLGMSWCFWPWKKQATWTSPASIIPPAGWDEVVRYASGTGPRPDVDEAQRALEGLLDAMPLPACEWRQEVVAALFHRVPVHLPVEAARSGGGMTLRRPDGSSAEPPWEPWDSPEAREPRFELVLDPGGWAEYAVEVRSATRVAVEVELGSEADLVVRIGEEVAESRSAGSRPRALTRTPVPAGRHVIRMEAEGGAVLRSLTVELARGAP